MLFQILFSIKIPSAVSPTAAQETKITLLKMRKETFRVNKYPRTPLAVVKN
jgi:hypothetical protein